MDLTQHVEELRHQLELAAEAGGDDARVVAGRLTATLESAARLVLLDAISAAAAEITLDLAPGSVDVRLRGRDPEFVVTPPPVDHPADSGPTDVVTPLPTAVGAPATDGDDTGPSRITLRLPEQLKGRIEEAAGRDGLSVNSWLVRAVSAAVGATDPQQRSGRSSRRGGRELHRLGPLAAPRLSHRSRSRRTSMPTFESPDPISITIDILGNTHITASDRTDTVVTVDPMDPSKSSDVKAAEQTVVDYSDGRLLVKSPRSWAPFSGSQTVIVTLEVPTGSTLDGTSPMGDFHVEGELGTTKVKTSMGNVRLDVTGELQAKTSFGNVTVDRVAGNADVTTSSGDIRLGEIEGTAVVKNSNGSTELDWVAGDVRAKSSNGNVRIGHAGAGVTVRTANGDVRVAEVGRGQVVIETAAGELEVGIVPGVAAWLDVSTRFGSVRNSLEGADGPDPSEGTIEVRARSSFGDIVIHRASADASAPGEWRGRR